MKKLCAFLLLAAIPLAQPVEAKASKTFPQIVASKKAAVKKVEDSSSSSSSCHAQDPEFGYFYLTVDQLIKGGCFEPVNWAQAGSVNTDDIFINPSDSTNILLKKPGYYLVTYSLTVDEGPAAVKPVGSDGPVGFQFALYLNDSNVPLSGSTYAQGTLNEEAIQLNGQVIFRVNAPDSNLRLVNQCEFTVELDNDAGTNNIAEFGPNVSGSMVVQRLSNLKFE